MSLSRFGSGLKPIRSQRGFSLTEILIALILLVIVTTIIFSSMSGAIRFEQKQKTEFRLGVLKNVITQYYTDNAMLIDNNSGDSFDVYNSVNNSNATGDYQIVNQSGFETGNNKQQSPTSVAPQSVAALGPKTSKAINILAEFAGDSPQKLMVDGFGRYFAFFVSDRLTANYSGPVSNQIYYHVIAIVSANGENTICGSQGGACSASSIFNPTTGQLNCPAGDQCAIINGLPIERAIYASTIKKMRKIARTYSSFFTSAYLSDSNRNPSVDYFSEPYNGAPNMQLFDSSSPICSSTSGNTNFGNCNSDQWSNSGDPYPGILNSLISNASDVLTDCQPATKLGGFMTSLGLSKTSVLSSWGYPFAVCNAGNATGQGVTVRNPASSNGNAQQPPYTAVIAAWAPGGLVLQVPVIGQY